MPSKNPPAKPTAKPAQPARPAKPAKPTLSVKAFQELRTAEQQAEAEASERAEHRSVIGAVAVAASSTPPRVKATKVAREAIWYRLTKRERLPLAKTEKDEGLVLFTGEEEGDAYVFVTCRLLGDNRDDELSRVVDRYQTALEKYGIASERVMRNLKPHLRVKVTRTDADIQAPGKRPPTPSRSLKRLADDDQDQTGDGMGI